MLNLKFDMRIAWYIKKRKLLDDPLWVALKDTLAGSGVDLVEADSVATLLGSGAEMLLSVGGDGTFLSAARLSVEAGIPILGVNLGRLGFLSENRPEDIAPALLAGAYSVEEREMLKVSSDALPEGFWPYALNEVSLYRQGAAMIGVDVSFDGNSLPTYWADGLLVATSSGSTGYALSAGGPIMTPDVRDLIIAPIAPHNLNVRPLVVPETTSIELSLSSRDGSAMLSLDAGFVEIESGAVIRVEASEKRLRRVVLGKKNFVGALRSRLFWGEDVRNSKEQ